MTVPSPTESVINFEKDVISDTEKYTDDGLNLADNSSSDEFDMKESKLKSELEDNGNNNSNDLTEDVNAIKDKDVNDKKMSFFKNENKSSHLDFEQDKKTSLSANLVNMQPSNGLEDENKSLAEIRREVPESRKIKETLIENIEIKSLKNTLQFLNSSNEAKQISNINKYIEEIAVMQPIDSNPLSLTQLEKISTVFSHAIISQIDSISLPVLDCLVKLFENNFWQYQLEAGMHIYNQQEKILVSKISSEKTKLPEETLKSIVNFDSETDSLPENTLLEMLSICRNKENQFISQLVDAVCKYSYSFETLDEKTQVYIIKVLTSAVISQYKFIEIHGASLISAVKVLFSLFLTSKYPTIQLLAQSAISQCVDVLCLKYKNSISTNNLGIPSPVVSNSLNSTGSLERKLNGTEVAPENKTSRFGDYDIYAFDAIFIIRYVLKLGITPLKNESVTDVKSANVRGKIFSLHITTAVFKNSSRMCGSYINVPIIDCIPFIHTIKQLLCFSFSRNVSNILPHIYNSTLDIFGILLLDLRSFLKPELSVIFTEVIIPFIEAKNSITFYQRLALFGRLCCLFSHDVKVTAKALVELYLNYDCDVDAGAKENIWERTIQAICKVISQVNTNSLQSGAYHHFVNLKITDFSLSSIHSLSKEQIKDLYSQNGNYEDLRKSALEMLVKGIIRPMHKWCDIRKDQNEILVVEHPREDTSLDIQAPSPHDDTDIRDDPSAFENIMQKKQILNNGINLFNFKPKNGIKVLLESKCILSPSPEDISLFLINTEGLNKTMLGEYLGEGDEYNIKIMHCFVDLIDFSGFSFVEALRTFLQTFRLPGEAQKIDRFMLKFAERFVKLNPGNFSSADTAYVLSYSVVMLNTDQHNTQVKKKMSKEEFIKNNRGIDNGEDLPAEYLSEIFDEISENEIIMNDDHQKNVMNEVPSPTDKPFFLQTLQSGAALVSNISQRADSGQFHLNRQRQVNRTEEKLNTIKFRAKDMSTTEESKYFVASHYEHIKNMFMIIWMGVLTSLSFPLQESEDIELLQMSLEGFNISYSISSIFDLELEKKAFLSTLCKYTLVNSVNELKAKNLEATKTLLDIAIQRGNSLGDDWKQVVICVSTLDKLQMQNNNHSLDQPHLRNSNESRRESRFDLVNKTNSYLVEAIAIASSQNMTILVDRIFAASEKLSGTAVVDFVKALCEISLEEINSSSDLGHPRMYCLQRLVEISYYNMNRIKIEWSNIWFILGNHFNEVGCHSNSNVGMFALDKLHQLSLKFLEMDELPSFKFQKDFLRPFEHVLLNSKDKDLHDLVLICLKQIILSKGKSLRSGWKTIFSAISKVSQNSYEHVVLLALNIAKTVSKDSLEYVIKYNVVSDYISCLVNFSRNRHFTRVALQSIELIKLLIPKVEDMFLENLAINEVNKQNLQISNQYDDPNFNLWFPLLFGLYEVVMTGELEVRTRALESLFKIMDIHGDEFSQDFWEVIAKGVLFPIFDDLRLSRQEHTKFANKDDFSEWLSTTLIQALRKLVELFTIHFSKLSFLLQNILDLMAICMMQENETLASVGGNCLQQLIRDNFIKFNQDEWNEVCLIFIKLFRTTTPTALFFDTTMATNDSPKELPIIPSDKNLNIPNKDSSESKPLSNHNSTILNESSSKKQMNLSSNELTRISSSLQDFDIDSIISSTGPPPERQEFQQIIAKCVLHLLAIQTLRDIMKLVAEDNVPITKYMGSSNVLILARCFEESYIFAKVFNANVDHRMALYKMGFMRQLPNLLMQETNSTSGYIESLFSLYSNEDDSELLLNIRDKINPLITDILKYYCSLDQNNRKRNIATWRPVIVIIIRFLNALEDQKFKELLCEVYYNIVDLVRFDSHSDISDAISALLSKVGKVYIESDL